MEFVDVLLSGAVRQLAAEIRVDIRIDVQAFRKSRVHEREPVSLTLSDRRLSTVLQVPLSNLEPT